jgi:hypothetical protein
LKNLPAVQQRTDIVWPRMADFAQWVVAAEPALGLEPGTFLKEYESNRQSARQIVLDSSPIVPAIRAMLKRKGGSFAGTATELLDAISVGQDTRVKGWPKTARPLAGMLSRLAPALREDGIEIHKGRDGNDKVWRLGLTIPARSHGTQSTQISDAKPKSEFAKYLRAKGVK